MDNQQTKLEKKIMRRIYLISYCKRALSAKAFRVYLTVALVWGLLANVSVTNVFRNTMDSGMSMSRTSHFYKYAFMHTELVVQASIVVALLFASYLLLNTVRGYNFYSPQQRV